MADLVMRTGVLEDLSNVELTEVLQGLDPNAPARLRRQELILAIKGKVHEVSFCVAYPVPFF